MSSKAETSYDEVPYSSHPYPHTHPRNLEALAVLFRLEPPPLPRCRVLELGCASGGNLIPIADELPQAQLLGIDLSLRQVRDGQSLIAELGLKNVELRAADINEIDDAWGQFDYILCHGVYSWVPSPVQDKILEVCRRNLAANGVAIVSYNTYPGWHFRAAVRDVMRYHVSQFEGAREQIAQAHAVLDFLVEACDEKEPYGQLLKRELRRVRAVDDSYLYHEHLEDYNQPTYFYQFIERAGQHGLQYLSEANVSRMFTIDMPPRVQEALNDSPIIRQEQYLDFLRNVGFRSTLLCHQAIELDRGLPDERMGRFWVQLSARMTPQEADLESSDPATFEIKGNKLMVSLPLTKAALVYLNRTWPEAVAVTDLHARALEALGLSGSSDDEQDSLDALGRMLKMALGANVLELYVHPPRCVSTITARPLASRLARLQAARQNLITNRWHRLVNLDGLGRFVLERLDGGHDRAALERELAEAIGKGFVSAEKEGERREPSAADVAEMVDWALRTCAGAGLLIA